MVLKQAGIVAKEIAWATEAVITWKTSKMLIPFVFAVKVHIANTAVCVFMDLGGFEVICQSFRCWLAYQAWRTEIMNAWIRFLVLEFLCLVDESRSHRSQYAMLNLLLFVALFVL